MMIGTAKTRRRTKKKLTLCSCCLREIYSRRRFVSLHPAGQTPASENDERTLATIALMKVSRRRRRQPAKWFQSQNCKQPPPPPGQSRRPNTCVASFIHRRSELSVPFNATINSQHNWKQPQGTQQKHTYKNATRYGLSKATPDI